MLSSHIYAKINYIVADLYLRNNKLLSGPVNSLSTIGYPWLNKHGNVYSVTL